MDTACVGVGSLPIGLSPFLRSMESLYFQGEYCCLECVIHNVHIDFAKYTIYLVEVGQGSPTNVLKISDMVFWNALPMLPFALSPNMLSSMPHLLYLLLLSFAQ